MKIDKKDITILRSLQVDARTKYSDIAKQCNVSVDTIIKRYNKLKKKGLIKRNSLILDPRKFGNKVIASLDIDIEPSSIPETIEHLNQLPGIMFATHAMGKYDAFAIVMKPSMAEMNNLKETIQSHPKIRGVKTSIWVEQFLLCPNNFELEKLIGA